MAPPPSVPPPDVLAAFQEASDDVFFVARTDTGALEYVSPACEQVLGYTAEELLNDPGLLARAVFPAADGTPARDSVQREETVEREVSFPGPDGETLRLRMRSFPVESDDGSAGNSPRVAGVLRDVTRETVAEESLRQSRASLVGIVERLPAGIMVATPERVLHANGPLLRMLALEIDDVVGSPPEDHFHVADSGILLEGLRTLLDDAGAGAGERPRTQLRLRSGSESWTTVAFTPVQALHYRGERGLLCLVQDLSTGLRVQAERDQARARYQSIFRHSPLGILLLDAETNLLDASPAVSRLLGWDDEVPAGATIRELVRTQDRDRVEAQIQALVAGDIPVFAQDTGLRTRRDTHVPVRLHVSRADESGADGGGNLLLVCLVEDISERVSLEQQLRTVARIESIGRLAGGIAHDFNNLVTVINGHTEMLLDETPENDLRRSDMREILQAGERAAGLTNQLLAFSRRTVQESRVLDLNEVVEGLRTLLGRTLGEDIEFVVEKGELSRTTVADRSQLEQVILNLVVNARDAMPKGGVLTVQTSDFTMDQDFALSRPGAVPGDYLRITVRDTGVGMSEDVLAHVFEPFFTTKAPGVGTGLGLATVYGIVKQSRGYVDVESTPGEGTSIHIYLPASDFETETRPTDRPVPVRGGHETILLVEDEEAVRSLAQRVLGLNGYRVFTASNGREGLAVADQLVGNIDLLVTDVVMPILGGRELAERLTANQPGLRTLFISGYPDDALLRHGMEEGTVQLLFKPFTAGEFVRRVREVLDAPPPSMPGTAPSPAD